MNTTTPTHSRFTALCPGLPMWAGTKRDIHPHTPETCCSSLSSFWILWGVGKIIEASAWTIRLDATHPDHQCPHLHHPPILRHMPLLPQTSQFILAWDRHQICWIAYLEACGRIQIWIRPDEWNRKTTMFSVVCKFNTISLDSIRI